MGNNLRKDINSCCQHSLSTAASSQLLCLDHVEDFIREMETQYKQEIAKLKRQLKKESIKRKND